MAERLSDKLQIMMVPADGKFFFTNDVLRGMGAPNHASQSEDAEGDRKVSTIVTEQFPVPSYQLSVLKKISTERGSLRTENRELKTSL